MFVCLFFYVCLFVVFCPTREIFPHMETSPLSVKGCKFLLCLALVAIEQWGYFSMPHLLWHGASVYNVHFRGPVTLSYRYLFLRLGSVAAGIQTPNLPLVGEHSNQLRHGRGYSYVYIWQCLMPCFEVYFICQEAHGLYCSPKQLWLRHFKRIAVMFVVPIWN